ncbi:MAG: YihY/virulence factor BrkB family protein [Candidatus Eremiobacteraeota bacterium]|nr:YihY/virulence factor BrkB family protein [Candidatus Eremiobacteraeota bacterium]
MGQTMVLLKSTWQAFNEDKAPRLATAIAYATLFAMVPLFIVLIAILGWFLGLSHGGHGHHVAEKALLDPIQRGAGGSAAEAVRQLVAASFNKPRQNVVAQIVGWVMFVVGATGLFTALQDALNDIWRIASSKGGWQHIVRTRIASFGMLGVVGFLLLVSFAGNAAVTAISVHFREAIPIAGGAVLFNVISWLLSLAIVTVIFALIYKVLPDVDLSWRDVWPGAIVTAVLFIVGQALIALYLTFAGVASAYGAAGSLLALLIWIYYSALILLAGAEFTKVRAAAARTTVPAAIRKTTDVPAGTDPRQA